MTNSQNNHLAIFKRVLFTFKWYKLGILNGAWWHEINSNSCNTTWYFFTFLEWLCGIELNFIYKIYSLLNLSFANSNIEMKGLETNFPIRNIFSFCKYSFRKEILDVHLSTYYLYHIKHLLAY